MVDIALPERKPSMLSLPAATLPQAQGGMRGGASLGPAPSPAPSPQPPAVDPMAAAEPAPTGEVLSGSPPPEADSSQIGMGQVGGDLNTRASSPDWLVMSDIIMGGTLPWAMAAVDVGTGQIPSEQFEQARMAYQQSIDAIKEQHPEFVAAAQKAAPLITGLGVGIFKPAQTVAGTAGRGAVAGAAQGAVQGYTDAPADVPSDDPQRRLDAVSGATRGGALGGAGGAVAGGVQKGMKMRADSKAAAAQAKEAEAATQRKETDDYLVKMEEKNAARRAEFEQKFQRDLAEKAASYTKKPKIPGPNWQDAQKEFLRDPAGALRRQAARNPSLTQLAEATNLSQASIIAKLKATGLPTPSSDAERTLRAEIDSIMETRKIASKSAKEAKAATTLTKPAEAGEEPLEPIDPDVLKRNMLPKDTAKAAKAPKKGKIDAQTVLDGSGTMDEKVQKLVAAGYDEKHARSRLNYLANKSTRDIEQVANYRTKYEKKPTAIQGWGENRKLFAKDPVAFLQANPGDDLMTLAAKVNMNPKTVAQRLGTASMDKIPPNIRDEIFEFNAGFKAATAQVRKQSKAKPKKKAD